MYRRNFLGCSFAGTAVAVDAPILGSLGRLPQNSGSCRVVQPSTPQQFWVMLRLAISTASMLLFCCGVAFGQASQAAQLHADKGLQLMQEGSLPTAEIELRQAVKLSPGDPTHLAELGVVLGMEQKLTDSDHYFQEALRFDPGDVATRRNLAKNQWRLGEFKGAEENLQKVLKAEPGDGGSTLILGMVEESLKHFSTAVSLLNSVPALVQQHPEAIAALAHSYYQLKYTTSARQTLRGLLQGNAPPAALYLGGQTALEAEDFTTAEELLAAAQPGYSDRAKIGYFLAFSRYRGGKFRACQDTVLGTLTAVPATRDLYALLGWCYAQQDKIHEAIEAFDQAVALDPANETTYLDLGTILLDHRRDKLALELGRETVEKFPNSYRAQMLMGTAEANFGYSADAIKSFGRAVELNPQSPEANYNLAMIQSAAGLTDKAVATLERGIKKFPHDAQHYQEYASFEVQRSEAGDAGAEAHAYEDLRRAISLNNNLPKPYLLLGRLDLKNNRVEQAAIELETAAKLDPNNPTIRQELSRAYVLLGEKDKAAKESAIYKTAAQAELQSGRLPGRANLRRW